MASDSDPLQVQAEPRIVQHRQFVATLQNTKPGMHLPNSTWPKSPVRDCVVLTAHSPPEPWEPHGAIYLENLLFVQQFCSALKGAPYRLTAILSAS